MEMSNSAVSGISSGAAVGPSGNFGVNGQIISNSDIQKARNYIDGLNSGVKDYIEDLDTVINSFSNKEIVDSFFKSGNFGEETRERLEKIRNAIRAYRLSISGVADVTIKFLNKQEELNNKGGR